MADFFSLRPNFYDDLAELFCQELATLFMLWTLFMPSTEFRGRMGYPLIGGAIPDRALVRG
jgi:hypothetical protein